MVPSHGHLRQTKWHTQKNNRLPTPQHPCYKRNTSHPVAFPPGEIGPSREEEDRLRSMERLPQCTPPPRRPTLHHVYHALGLLKISDCPTRLHCLGRRIHQKIQRNHLIHPQQTECVDDTSLWSDTIEESFLQAQTGWTPAADKGSPGEVLLRSRRGRICRL